MVGCQARSAAPIPTQNTDSAWPEDTAARQLLGERGDFLFTLTTVSLHPGQCSLVPEQGTSPGPQLMDLIRGSFTTATTEGEAAPWAQGLLTPGLSSPSATPVCSGHCGGARCAATMGRTPRPCCPGPAWMQEGTVCAGGRGLLLRPARKAPCLPAPPCQLATHPSPYPSPGWGQHFLEKAPLPPSSQAHPTPKPGA